MSIGEALEAGASDIRVFHMQVALWNQVHSINRSVDRPFVETGRKVREGGKLGGKPKGNNLARDMRLADEFRERKIGSKVSDTALKERIGKENGLARSAAIAAINRGLQKLSG